MSAQLENGYIRIANEIWDEIIRRDFTKRQKDILLFIWRLSYGCSKKTAIIPKLKHFSICGVGATNITSELKYLQIMKVIYWDRENMVFSFNKDYGIWQVTPVRGWDDDTFNELLHVNISSKTSQNDKLSKREVINSISENLLNQEVEEPEIPCGSKDEGVSKDSIKDINNIYIVSDEKQIFDHWNSAKIVKHREMSKKMESSVRARLKDRTADEIKQAINNYSDIIKGEKYFFSYKWGLDDFMNPKNIDRFLDENEPKKNFLSDKYKDKRPTTTPIVIPIDRELSEEDEAKNADIIRRQQELRTRTGTTPY